MTSPPAHRSDFPAPTALASHAGAGAPRQRVRAFLVEDSAVIRDNLIATLDEMSDVSVIGFATDEAGALAWLARPDHHAVALLIVDIFLAGGSGLGVLRGVAALGLPLQVVVLTNYATPELRRKCLELGAHRVFDKSTEIDALIDWCAVLAGAAAAA
jgi:DNA-binding NarL/FixJ family response regulator